MQHEVFDHFTPFQGTAPAGYILDFAGMCLDQKLLDPDISEILPERMLYSSIPQCSNEAYFELIGVATGIISAKETFTMVELGAGYGYWISEGGCLARRHGLRTHLVGVEAEPTHFKLMQQHLANNKLDAKLIEAAVTTSDGTAYFEVGDPFVWWGQGVRESISSATSFGNVVEVRGISIPTILKDIDFVDVLHMDVQGIEADVLESCIGTVNEKVGILVVGTHSNEIEIRLRELFRSWEPMFDFTLGSTNDTPYGIATVGDGVQVDRVP